MMMLRWPIVIMAWLASGFLGMPGEETVQSAEPVTLRVLSYNIHHAEGMDGKLDLERIASVIKSVKPDLVALQEVDRKTERSRQIDEPAVLARLTGMQVLFEKNIAFQGGEYGNAILSRLPVRSHRNHRLPNHRNGEQRGALEAELVLPGGRGTLVFWNTHLDHRSNPSERLASAQALEKIVRERKAPLGILAGDLNSTLSAQVLPIFLRTWTNSNGAKPQPTVPVGKPNRQIDFVLYRPKARWQVQSFQVLPEQVASDHRAVLAVLQLMPVSGE